MTETRLRPAVHDDRDWIVNQHIELYRAESGFDDTFDVLVAQIATDFFENQIPGREMAWIAECDGAPMGSIFCTQLNKDTAQLRLFFLREQARGSGLGRKMLHTCMEFAHRSGYQDMRLWTHRSHASACALYRKVGWECVGAEATVSFGQQEVIETYVYHF